MAAMSRSSNSDIWKAPPSIRPRIAGARSAVIQSSPAGLMSCVMRAWVIMPRSPTSTTWSRPKRCLSLVTWLPERRRRRSDRESPGQMSLFDDRDMAAITSPDFPGERLILCRNHALATERELARIGTAVVRKREPLRGKAEIGLAVGAVIDRHKMAKHFDLQITDTSFAFARKTAQIAAEAALDGLYAVRTSLPETALDHAATVKSYKSLSLVERAIRSIKTVDLQVRPVYHWLADRVRAHVFLCMLGYYLEWHMRQRLAPLLYDDDDKEAAEALRASVVAKAERSPAAVAKQTTGRTPDGLPVHSFQTLIADLATITRNTVTTALAPDLPFTITTRPTPIQSKAFDLLAVNCTQ